MSRPTQVSGQAPNILLVMTDDQGWGDISAHGNPDIDTPVMDRLSEEGASFDWFFVSPVCAPTRASLLTGRYYLRTGTQWVTHGLETMRPGEVTIAEIFKDAGYATGIFGKWHNGSHYPSDPVGQGFDTFVGFMAGHWNNYFDTNLESNGGDIQTEGFISDVLTDSAIAFIERDRNRPFLAYVPYNAPHSPFQVPDRYFDKYKSRGLDDKTAAVYGMVENIDDNLGRLLRTLADLDLTQNTIVIFLTDNGPNGERYNGGMKGWKSHLDEGGSRVPLFIRWPSRIEPGTRVGGLAAHIDLLPTLADLADIPLPAGLELDGISVAPEILGESDRIAPRTIFTHQFYLHMEHERSGAVRTDRWRMVPADSTWELYDMIGDPGQKVDVAADHPDVVDELDAKYRAWYEDVTRELDDKPRIPVGYSEASRVVLPAIESQAEGGLHFEGGMGWANDWLTNWVSQSDKAGWRLEVIAAQNV